ncbi:Metallo-dependent hydrolase [Pluteus cervinus]|uniref:Metallo-dependent hydrolase n=1 Tax=Pluteus cervinus TaxID=181527 RepID=A0ACD3BAG0_9AGAR|nr:Metallo-dependent hydrolase [Pluteus cervinus]
MTSPNGLVCFTNCLLPQEDGSLVEKDLWIDESRGVILDAQRTFFLRKERPARIVDLGGNILSPGFIDVQINGGYGFDFSVYDGDDDAYRAGMKTVAERIIETGVTSLVPTIITQESALYPKLLQLLRPFSTPASATLLGWHAEGPFLDFNKRGAHAHPFLLKAENGVKTFEEVYGAENLAEAEDWLMSEDHSVGVRMITAAPEIEGVMKGISTLSKRGIVFSIGHSVATSQIATSAVVKGARLITHLFNAMPQLHHRDPSIIGLLGASPHLASQFTPVMSHSLNPRQEIEATTAADMAAEQPATVGSEAFDNIVTPPQTPLFAENHSGSPASNSGGNTTPVSQGRPVTWSELNLKKGHTVHMGFERPFYGMIVDGIHSHPNSVRLAYSAYPEGCILITDAMKILDPNLRDGVHEWRDGKRFVKEGDKLYLEGTTTLAGSVVTMDTCVRNFSRFTGCSLGEAIKCATYNPAKCLGIEKSKGTLRPGAHADLVVLDRHGIVLNTWVRGKEAWARSK